MVVAACGEHFAVGTNDRGDAETEITAAGADVGDDLPGLELEHPDQLGGLFFLLALRSFEPRSSGVAHHLRDLATHVELAYAMWIVPRLPVREALAAAHRDPTDFRIAKRVYVTVGDDADAAHRRTAEALARIYRNFGLRDMVAVAVTGSVADVVAGLHDVIAAGAELVMLNPLFDDLEQLERLATDPEIVELGM